MAGPVPWDLVASGGGTSPAAAASLGDPFLAGAIGGSAAQFDWTGTDFLLPMSAEMSPAVPVPALQAPARIGAALAMCLAACCALAARRSRRADVPSGG